MLAALACVDAVTHFDEDTPAALISKLLPDVLVKGGDYTVETVVGRDEVEAAGGEVVLIPFLEGYSTSNLLSLIRDPLESYDPQGCIDVCTEIRKGALRCPCGLWRTTSTHLRTRWALAWSPPEARECCVPRR